jgi:GH35 family endo-1,4-beta-xylanase
MKYPKVGEKFYWKDLDNEIHEEICMKIEGDDIDTLETMFFTYISKNGGGCFVTESDIIDSNSDEVKKFKKEQAEKKVKEVIDYLNQEEVRKILMAKLMNEYDWLEANKILDILSNYTL